jgi:hypothetical protein
VNRHEIEEELKVLNKKVEVMQNDLTKFAVELSATSQVAIIARIVQIEIQIKEYEAMLDVLAFEDITKDF